MPMKKRMQRRWAARKVAEAAAPLTQAEQDRLAVMDALKACFRVSMAGVDITDHLGPQLPPELDKKRRT